MPKTDLQIGVAVRLPLRASALHAAASRISTLVKAPGIAGCAPARRASPNAEKAVACGLWERFCAGAPSRARACLTAYPEPCRRLPGRRDRASTPDMRLYFAPASCDARPLLRSAVERPDPACRSMTL